MMTLLLLLSALRSDPFVVDAEWRSVIRLAEGGDRLRTILGSTEFLSQVMPNVTEIRPLGGEEFLYRTERSVPFAGVVRTDFRIRRENMPGRRICFRTPVEETNYMVLEFLCEEEPGGGSTLNVRLRVRLTREDASAIHPFAPLLGAGFISERMERELEETLEAFADRLAGRLAARHNEQFPATQQGGKELMP